MAAMGQILDHIPEKDLQVRRSRGTQYRKIKWLSDQINHNCACGAVRSSCNRCRVDLAGTQAFRVVARSLGPNRAGPFGLLQVAADMIKIFTKEDWVPPFSDKPVFVIAPAIIVVTTLLSFAVIPMAPGIEVANLNIGLLFFLAMSSLGVYSIALGRLVFG